MLAFKITLVAALLTLAAGLPRRRPNLLGNGIVGGEPADIKDFPYQVSLQRFNNQFCGASVITDKIALTAAHCAVLINRESGSIVAGSSRISEVDDGERYAVDRATVHELYNSYTIDYDIGLVHLVRAFQFGPTIKPIALPEANENVLDNTEAIVSGWGILTEDGGVTPDVLQKVKVFLIPQDTCKTAYLSFRGVTDRMICAAAEGKDHCYGDSGGPLLVANGKQIGIVSWALGCAEPGHPGVYARVSNPELRQFIKRIAEV